jgi:subfamily B ATP-binding cassette protein HlyB/CyaB
MSPASSVGQSVGHDPDRCLKCLALLAQYHQVAADVSQLQHLYGRSDGSACDKTDVLRAASALGLRAKASAVDVDDLAQTPLPLIAFDPQGQPFIIARLQLADTGRATGEIEQALIQDPATAAPQTLSKDALNSRYSGNVILLSKRLSLRDALQQKFDIRWFIPSLIKYKKHFGEVIIAAFFLQLFALITPLFFQVVMDKVLVHQGFTTLNVLAVGLFIVLVFDALVGGLRNYLFAHTANRVDVELGARLFRHLTHLPLSWFEARQVGQSVARVRELETIRNFITGTALTLVIDLSFTVVFFAVMWLYSPTLTLVVLGTLPLYIILSVLITPVLRKRLDEKFRHGAANQAFLVEAVGGMETLKSQAVEPQMQRRWEDQLANYVNASFKTQNLSNIANQIAGLLSKLTTLMIIWMGAHLVIRGDLTVGQLVAFNMIAGRVTGPILKLVQLWQDFQQAGLSIKRLGDILNAPAEPGFSVNRSVLPTMKGDVQLEQVRFRYQPDGPLVLDDISLHVKPGEIVGLVGRSGSGKSTLGKLLQRLYVPESGRIRIDDADLGTVDSRWLRQQVGVVQQESCLFHRSIRENIALANPAAPMSQVINAAKLAGAHDFISELPDGYDTMIEERGANFSGGQRQRIAIARALISQPRLLIFDEATSALDYESERVIQNHMHHICENRTVFIIAHRLSTVRHADRIIVMDKGRIIESGPHEALLAQGGYYAELHRYQNEVPPIRRVATAGSANSSAEGNSAARDKNTGSDDASEAAA